MSTLPQSAKQALDSLSQMPNWEDKYRQIILWGKALDKMPAEKRLDSALVSGCEAQVWLYANQENAGNWQFEIDSNTRIVRGLIVLVLAAFQNQTSEYIQSFDFEGYFNQLGIAEQLTSSRATGLAAIVAQIKQLALVD